MNEIIFLVEEAPEGGFTARALGESIFTEADHMVLLSNQRDGEIKAEARFVRKSRRIIMVRTRITGNEGHLPAEVTSTHIPANY